MTNIRGIEQHQELRSTEVYRDIRPPGTRLAETLRNAEFVALVYGLAGLSILIAPFFSWEMLFLVEPLGIVGLLFWLWLRREKPSAPLHIPKYARLPDPNDRVPATGKPKIGSGISFLGVTRNVFKQIWANVDWMTRHMLILGTTGSGKSELMKALLADTIIRGSGGIYVDGKADNTLYQSIFQIARRLGRDDDLRVLNFLANPLKQGERSNTMSPLATASVNSILNLVVSLLGSQGAGGGDIWRQRAISLLESIVPTLVWLRDNRGMLLNFAKLREAMQLETIIHRSRDTEIPPEIRSGLIGYLKDLPGYKETYFNDQGEEMGKETDKSSIAKIREQHGYLQMQYTRVLQNLTGTYGAIFQAEIPDIDMADVILNRRIAVFMLPALKVSKDELANLGRIISAMIKELMGGSLGAKLEGLVAQIVDAKPTAAASPFDIYFDEVGYYLSDGMDLMAAQARSLLMRLVFGSQEINSLRSMMEKMADAIMGNNAIKFFLKIEEPEATRRYVEARAGDADVAEVSGYSSQPGMMTGRYSDRMDAGVARKSRVNWLDITGQGPGEAHMTCGADLFRMQVIYVSPPKVKYMRVHRFLELLPPDGLAIEGEAEVTKKEVRPKARVDFGQQRERAQLVRHLSDPDWKLTAADDLPASLHTVATAFSAEFAASRMPHRAAAAAIMSYLDSDNAKVDTLAAAFGSIDDETAAIADEVGDAVATSWFAASDVDVDAEPEAPDVMIPEALAVVTQAARVPGDAQPDAPVPEQNLFAEAAAVFVAALEPTHTPAVAIPERHEARTPMNQAAALHHPNPMPPRAIGAIRAINMAVGGQSAQEAQKSIDRLASDLSNASIYPGMEIPVKSPVDIRDLLAPIYANHRPITLAAPKGPGRGRKK